MEKEAFISHVEIFIDAERDRLTEWLAWAEPALVGPNVKMERGLDMVTKIYRVLNRLYDLLSQAKEPKKGLSRIKSLISWAKRRDTMNKELELCRELNNTLYSIATPHMEVTRSIILESTEIQAELRHRLDTVQDAVYKLSHQVTEMRAKLDSRADHGEQEQHIEDAPPLIQTFYHISVDGLRFVGEIMDNKEIVALHDRLEMWGLGLFEGELDLDNTGRGLHN
jgi:hypothetical protein